MLPSSLYGNPFARRWTRESSGLRVVRFVQTDLSTSRGALYSGAMRRRHSWGGDALWVSCMFDLSSLRNAASFLLRRGTVRSALRKIARQAVSDR